MVERLVYTEEAVGSIPTPRTNLYLMEISKNKIKDLIIAVLVSIAGNIIVGVFLFVVFYGADTTDWLMPLLTLLIGYILVANINYNILKKSWNKKTSIVTAILIPLLPIISIIFAPLF